MNTYLNNICSYEFDCKNNITFASSIDFTCKKEMSQLVENSRLFSRCTAYLKNKSPKKQEPKQEQEDLSAESYCYYENEAQTEFYIEHPNKRRRVNTNLSIDDSLCNIPCDNYCDMV